MKKACVPPLPSTDAAISFKGYRFPPDVISYAVCLYYWFPLSLRMAEEMLAPRGIELTYETVRKWAGHFGWRSPSGSARRHPDEVRREVRAQGQGGLGMGFVRTLERVSLRLATSASLGSSDRRTS